MKYPRALLFVVAVASALTLAFAPGCSSSKSNGPAAATCDPTQCAPKNECLSDGKETKCRLPCVAQTDCPFNYTCNVNTPKSFCTKNTVQVPQQKPGQWGTPCKAADGTDGNPACDAAATSGTQKFGCYAKNPTDANAYCTLYDCTQDSDCAGGYWCATLNASPNAKEAKRSLVDTRNVCLRREYCAPCKGDLDCPTIAGTQQSCVQDNNGAGFCTLPCQNDSNCALDASCQPIGKDGANVCSPRAGTCKGDGSLCSPCRSDADCPNGYCINADYSSEKFCSIGSGTPCSASSNGDCPKKLDGVPNAGNACIGEAGDPEAPKDQCVGFVQFGTTQDSSGKTVPVYVKGCWTVTRK